VWYSIPTPCSLILTSDDRNFSEQIWYHGAELVHLCFQ